MDITRQQAASAQYPQTVMGWGIKGISFLTTNPEAFKEVGKEGMTLLAGFKWADSTVGGEVEAEKLRDLVKLAMSPIKSFFLKGAFVTCAFFFGSRIVSFLPIVPSVLLLCSGITGLVTLDVGIASSKMKGAYVELNRIHLRKTLDQTAQAGDQKAKVNFEQFVAIVDGYAQEAFVSMWTISCFPNIEASLINWRPLLTELVQNQTEESKAPPSEILQKHLPILRLICRVNTAARV